MAQHTPGPWKVERINDTNYVMGRVGHVIAEVPADRNYKAKADVNAALIAAAPDLLAALEAVLDMPNNSLALYEARAAIAKAKGE
jgi:hypothetical protein